MMAQSRAFGSPWRVGEGIREEVALGRHSSQMGLAIHVEGMVCSRAADLKKHCLIKVYLAWLCWVVKEADEVGRTKQEEVARSRRTL